MIATIIIITLAFIWLGYETDFMRVRLLVGKVTKNQGIWQLQRFEPMVRCNKSHNWISYKLPARTIKAYGHTMNLAEGCNICRAKLLKEVKKSQEPTKPKAPYPASHYPVGLAGGMSWGYAYDTGELELLIDGKHKATFNGDYKRGMIASEIKPYITKARVGRKSFNIPVGEADRVTA